MLPRLPSRLPRGLAALACAAALIAHAPRAHAHPEGVSSVNRYLGAVVGDDGNIRLAYLLDFAELPAYTEIERLDRDHDGNITPAERTAYLAVLLPPIVAAWTVNVNGARVHPRIVGSALEAPPGQGGLPTLRISVELAIDARVDPTRDTSISISDPTFADRSGWREIGASDSPRARVVASSVQRASTPLSYLASTFGAAPRMNEGTFTFRTRNVGDALVASNPHVDHHAASRVADALAPLAARIRSREGGLAFLLALFALAFALGAGHALSPGHGKALVAAYLVGARGTTLDALALGAIVTVTHTLSVFVLGVLALTLEQTIGSARVLHVLELASGVAIVVVALTQLPRRLRALRTPAVGAGYRSVGPRRRAPLLRAPRDAHARLHADEAARAAHSWRGLIALGVSGGLVPCPGALVVLLTAMAVHRIALGLALVGAFSLGLAGVLMTLGVLFVLARRALDRVRWNGPLVRALPVLSSVCTLVLGLAICASSWAPV